jgi:drug/metabolite transporter (DMT)-like permease
LDKRTLGFLAALGATIIYGLNHTIAKNVMPTYITPFGFILLRVLGAAILFWVVSFFIKPEKIQKKRLASFNCLFFFRNGYKYACIF